MPQQKSEETKKHGDVLQPLVDRASAVRRPANAARMLRTRRSSKTTMTKIAKTTITKMTATSAIALRFAAPRSIGRRGSV